MGRENFQTEWVQRAREQDQEALEALYVCCYSEVYKTIREATRADGDTIKDILQETYIRAFTKDPDGSAGDHAPGAGNSG